jgi:hypothetical protein
MNKNRYLSVFTLLLCCWFATAGDFDPGSNIAAPQSTPLLSSTLFGDQFDTRSGTGSFSLFDIDLPGNSTLPVRLKHLESFTHANSNRAQSGHSPFPSPTGQKFQIPVVYGIVPSDNTRTLCSAPIDAAQERQAAFGPTVIIDGEETSLFRLDGNGNYPVNTQFVGKNHWLINCFTDADGYEGFNTSDINSMR